MTEWNVVGVIIAVVGLIAAVTGPIVKLISSITKLTVMMSNVTDELRELAAQNSKNHEHLDVRLKGHDKELASHDKRIHVLETDKKEQHNGNQYY